MGTIIKAHEREDLDPMARLSSLAGEFPTLRETAAGLAPGVYPFDPDKLEAWARGPEPGSGALHAVRFLLGVYAPRHGWTVGRFDVFKAVGVWDDEHMKVFRKWTKKPWTR